MNQQLSDLLDKLTEDTGNICYICFYSDGSGFVKEEVGEADRFVLSFKDAADAVVQIEEYLNMDMSKE